MVLPAAEGVGLGFGLDSIIVGRWQGFGYITTHQFICVLSCKASATRQGVSKRGGPPPQRQVSHVVWRGVGLYTGCAGYVKNAPTRPALHLSSLNAVDVGNTVLETRRNSIRGWRHQLHA